jgi:hypothetical protein
MIELYCRADCPFCADIEVIIVEEGDVNLLRTESGECVALPTLNDNRKLISGAEPIKAHLRDLEEFVASWRKFQSGACYCDEDE